MRSAPFWSISGPSSVRPGFLGIEATWDGAARALFLAVTLVVVITFTDYGITWDEDVHNYYGILVLNYYLSGFTDLRATHWQDLFNYGGAFDMIAADSAVSNATVPLPNEPAPSKNSTRIWFAGSG